MSMVCDGAKWHIRVNSGVSQRCLEPWIIHDGQSMIEEE